MPNPLYGTGQQMAAQDSQPRWDTDPQAWTSFPTATRLGYVDAWRQNH